MSRASNLAGFSTSIQSVAPSNLVVGVVTATTFSGNITGTAATFTGNVSIAGTLTYEDVTNVDSVGIITARTGVRIDAGGLVVTAGVSTFAGIATHTASIFGTQASFSGVITATTFSGAVTGDVTGNINSSGVSTFTTLNGTSGLVSVGTTFKTKGFVETQSTVSIGGTILTLDASQGTVFTHTTSAQIGIVSFTGIRTDTAGTQTFTVLVTQGATPVNTTGAAGIGTQLASIRIIPGNVGYSTHIKVGGGTSITLTNSAGALDLLTFIVSYNGATSIANTSFTVVGFAATDFRNAIV